MRTIYKQKRIINYSSISIAPVGQASQASLTAFCKSSLTYSVFTSDRHSSPISKTESHMLQQEPQPIHAS